MNRLGLFLLLALLAGAAVTALVVTSGGDRPDASRGPSAPGEPGPIPEPKGPGPAPADPEPEPAAPVTEGLFGVVLGPDGEPASGARVIALSGQTTGWAVSGEDGRFALALSKSGVYSLTARAGDFAPGTLAGVEFEAGTRVEGLSIRLAAGAVVRGGVYDASGGPVAGARVMVLPADASMDAMLGAVVAANAPSGTTDEAGEFRVTGVGAGEFVVEARADGRAAARSEPFRVEAGGEARADVVFPDSPAVTGIVLDRRGEPVAGASVSPVPQGMAAFVPGAATGPTATTAEDGAFSLSGLEGPTDLQATKEGYGKATAAGVQPGQGGVEFRLRDLGSIAGRVLVEGGTAPEFEIEARSAGAGVMGMGALFPSGTVELVGEGKFRIVGLEPGGYQVTVFPEGYAPARVARVDVKEGEETGGVEVRLTAGFELRGVVTAKFDGRPVAGVAVSAFLLANPMLAQAGRGRTRTVTTGEDGVFVLSALPEGTTTVKFVHADYASLTLPAVTLPADAPLAVELDGGGTVVVRARKAGGVPDAGKMVILQRNAPFEQKMATLDARGEARFEHVAEGTWMVMRMDPQAMQERGFAGADMVMETVTVASGAEVEVVFAPKGGATIRGRITRGDHPVSGAMVYLTGGGEASEVLSGMKFATSSEDGSYELTDVPPGAWTVAVSRSGSFVPTFSQPVQVEGGSLVVDLRLPLGTASGRVTDPRGQGLGGVQVIAVPAARADFRSGSVEESMRSFGGIETTSADGGFRFDGLSPGNYVLRAWREGSAPAFSETFSIPDLGDGPQDLRIALSAGVEVTVEVRGPDRAPVAGAWVFATDPDGRILTVGMNTGERTDSEGVARLRLATGRYVLEVQARGLAARSVSIQVPDGSLSLIVDLREGGRINVTARDTGGRPVVGARVTLLDEAGRPAGRRMTGDVLTDAGDPTRTDESGRLTLPLVGPGSWRVSVVAEDGARAEATAEVAPGRTTQVDVVLEK